MNTAKRTIAAIVLLPLLLLMQACGGGNGEDVRNPTVTVTASQTSGAAPLTVTFTITASDADGTVDKVEADFDGDGTFEEDITGVATRDVTYTTSAIVTVTIRATDNEGRTGTATVTITIASKGEVFRTIPYPIGVFDVKDVVYDRFTDTLWLLSDEVTRHRLVGLDRATGVVVGLIPLVSPVFFTATLQDVAFDGSFFWITSNVPARIILQVDTRGLNVGTLPCLAPITDQCNGMTFDGSTYWTGASSTNRLDRFTTFASLGSLSFSPPLTVGVDDVAFDRGTDQLVVIASGPRSVHRLNSSTGVVADTFTDATLGQKGDWDGSLFWFVDNPGQQLRGVFID